VRSTEDNMRSGRSLRLGEQVVRNINRQLRKEGIPLESILTGAEPTRDPERTPARSRALAELHPAHAVYVHAQNQAAEMAEKLLSLPELEPHAEMIATAEDEYMPSGPPMSPLTRSFFTFWSLFDARPEPRADTVGEVVMTVGSAFGMHANLVRLIGLLQDSRMGVFGNEGSDRDGIRLRELRTGRSCLAVCPSGYRGRKGELCYARVLPPPAPGIEEHVVLTTPYLLLQPGEGAWLAYFDRALAGVPAGERAQAFEDHLKYGPAIRYWTEFVLEAYVNHRPDAILLAGLPDVAGSRPHARRP